MKENPYAPPKAAVDDVVAVEPEMQRPREIMLVIQVAVIGYLLGIIVMVISWDYYAKLQSITSAILGQVVSIAIFCWIYYKIYQGRNWARITLLVFTIIGLLGLIISFSTVAVTLPTLPKVQMVVGFALSGLQLWWLFVSPGKHWFRRNRNEPVRAGEYTKAK